MVSSYVVHPIKSSEEFFTEIGEDVFVVGKEVAPSQTVQDRIDLLGIDSEGTSVIVELRRGSNKLQMLQAITYAGMVARWDRKTSAPFRHGSAFLRR